MIAADEGKISLNNRLNLDNTNAGLEEKSGSGIILHLSSPVNLTIFDLCYLMIAVSDNYATDLLLDILGFDDINKILNQLGLKITRVDLKISQYTLLHGRNPTTPYEISFLLNQIYCKKLPFSPLMDEILQNQIYGTRLPLLLLDDLETGKLSIAHKTGTIEAVAHDAGIIRAQGKNYILCVLTQNQKNLGETNMAIAKLSLDIYQKVVNNNKNTSPDNSQ